MNSGNVVVVGAINVDLVVAADRLPGPGETVVGPQMARHGGGKGANAAVAAARAGAAVRLIGAIGDDDLGRAALAELAAEGIDVAGVAVLEGVATGVALIVVDARGENQIAVGAGANALVSADQVNAGAFDGADAVLVSTEIPGAAVSAAVTAAAAAGVRCVLNPAPVIPAVAELVRASRPGPGHDEQPGPVLTPNAGELADLAAALGVEVVMDELGPAGAGRTAAAAEAIGAMTGSALVVTLGADGVLVARPGAPAEQLPPRPAQVRDTTGAGDTFNGVLAARLAAGDDLASAVGWANAAAALSVGAVGARTGMPRPPEIAAHLA